jgi:hypothetical protein
MSLKGDDIFPIFSTLYFSFSSGHAPSDYFGPRHKKKINRVVYEKRSVTWKTNKLMIMAVVSSMSYLHRQTEGW